MKGNLIKNSILTLILITYFLNSLFGQNTETKKDDIFKDFTESNSMYIESDLPDMKPKLFLPDLIDYTKHHIHSAPAYTPDGKIMFFSVYHNYSFPQKIYKTIYNNGKWSKPELLSFSGKNQEGGPQISPDGKKLFFYSRRLDAENSKDGKESRTWYSEINNGKCSPPKLLNIDSKHGLAFYPMGFKNNNVLQISAKKGRMTYEDYDLEFKGDQINKINISADKFDIPGATFYRMSSFSGKNYVVIMVYNVTNGAQLYISYKSKTGEWTQAKSMGDMINKGQARFPGFTHDKKYFYFSSYRSGVEKWYWINAKIIDFLKKNDLNLVDKFTKIVKDEGVNEAEKQLKKITKKYKDYYVFDSNFIESTALKLIENNNIKKAESVLSTFTDKYPNYKLLMLKASLSDESQESLINEINVKYKKDISEQKINALGYRFLRMKLNKIAEYIFELNTKLFPKSANAFDSYAEALMIIKQKEEAIKNYKKSLELNPKNYNALEMLHKLQPKSKKFLDKQGAYLGQKISGDKPEKFAPGIICTNTHEFSFTISPDGKEILFTRKDTLLNRNTIMITQLENKYWTEPCMAPGAGDIEGFEPCFSPDGKKLYFKQWRTVPGVNNTKPDIWFMDKTKSGWGEPQHLEHPFNPDKSMFISATNTGVIYTTDISRGFNTGRIVKTYLKNGEYKDFEIIGPPISIEKNDMYPFISPDESYLIFNSRRESGGKEMDLFITYRQKNNTWSEPVKIETGLSNCVMPWISADEKYLFFTHSNKKTKGDIYWMKADFIKNKR